MVAGRKYLKTFSKSLGIAISRESIRKYERHIVAQSEALGPKASIVSHIEMHYGLFSSGQIRLLSIGGSFIYGASMLLWLAYLYLPDGGQ